MEKYYKAYDKRYKQVHDMNLEWSVDIPSPIIDEIIEKYGISKHKQILELGCGEGRDAFHLLKQGYDVIASDCSDEVIQYCKNKIKAYADHFMVLDVCKDKVETHFDFIYSIAVLHMLVLQEDRDAFYLFIKEHLKEKGMALILTMGDGQFEVESDISNAFDSVKRVHQETGKEVEIAATSCKMVSFETLKNEIENMGFEILEKGITSIESHFDQMMYVVVKE